MNFNYDIKAVCIHTCCEKDRLKKKSIFSNNLVFKADKPKLSYPVLGKYARHYTKQTRFKCYNSTRK